MVAGGVTYKQLWKQVSIKASLFVALSATLFFVVYKLIDSILFGIAAVFILILLYRFLFGGQLKKRKRQVARVFNDRFSLTEESPLLEENPFLDSSDTGWLKGVGYIGTVAQPIWVKVNEQGVVFYYLCRSRIAPFVVVWNEVNRVSVNESTGQALAKIYISGIREEIYIPWDNSFNGSVPGTVGFNIEH